MGGGTTQIQQPAPPPAPSVSSSIQDFISAQPQLFALQQQQAPLEAAQQLQLLQEFGPQFGQAVQEAQRSLNPETTAIQEELAQQAREGSRSGLSASREAQLKSDIRAQLGTNVGSEIGAFEFGRQLDIAREQERDKFRNLGLSLAGRQPLAQPQAPSFSNFAGSFTPGQALGFNQGVFGNQANIFGTQSSMATNQANMNLQRRGQNMDLFGNIIGGGLSAAGSIGGAAMMAPAASDARLKENIKNIGELQGKKIYKYNYVDSPVTHIGVLAQEVDKEYTDIMDNGYLGVYYDKLFEEV